MQAGCKNQYLQVSLPKPKRDPENIFPCPMKVGGSLRVWSNPQFHCQCVVQIFGRNMCSHLVRSWLCKYVGICEKQKQIDLNRRGNDLLMNILCKFWPVRIQFYLLAFYLVQKCRFLKKRVLLKNLQVFFMKNLNLFYKTSARLTCLIKPAANTLLETHT